MKDAIEKMGTEAVGVKVDEKGVDAAADKYNLDTDVGPIPDSDQ